MNSGVLTLSEALQIMDAPGRVYSIKWVQADKKRGTGGKISFAESAQKCVPEEMPVAVLHKNKINLASEKKNPAHYENKTRNIYLPDTREIKKVHISLILELNGKTILL